MRKLQSAHGADDPGPAYPAGGISFQRLHPRQSYPRGGAGAGASAGTAGRPAQCEHRAAQSAGFAGAGPG